VYQKPTEQEERIKPASRRNLGTKAEVNNGEKITNEETMAKIQMAYDMGRGAREANSNSNKQELMNFLKTCEENKMTTRRNSRGASSCSDT